MTSSAHLALVLASVLAAVECWRPMVSRDPMRDPTLEYKPPTQPWESQGPSARLRPPSLVGQTSWGGSGSPQSGVHHQHYQPGRPAFRKQQPHQYHHHQPQSAASSTAYHSIQPFHHAAYLPSYHNPPDQTPLPSATLHLQVVTPQGTTTTTSPPTTTSYRPPPAVVMEGHSKVKKYGPVEGSVNSVFLQSGKFPLYPVKGSF